MNLFFDTMAGVIGDLSSLDPTDINLAKSVIEGTIAGASGILNQSKCEITYETSTVDLQIFFILSYEILMQ